MPAPPARRGLPKAFISGNIANMHERAEISYRAQPTERSRAKEEI
jgi:hypothetical protein